MSTIGEAIDRCESPIERAFLVGLLVLGDFTFSPSGPLPTIAKDATGVELLQQVDVRGYRIDFGLTRAGASTRLAIELDGFVHHGATPEQFERDKARERALTGLGWTFLRFSGREVRRDPRRCADEAMAKAVLLLVDPPTASVTREERMQELVRRIKDAMHRNDGNAHAALVAELGRLDP